MADPVAPMQQAQDQESRADADPVPQDAKFWLGEIAAAEKREERWWKRGSAVVARFRDEREREHIGDRRANILWSNTELLKAALFNGLGHPDVRRRFPKRGNDERAARTASIVLERGLSYCQDAYDADTAVECAIEDMLLPGRGVAWVVYEADVENDYGETAGADDAGATGATGDLMGHNGGPSMEIAEQRVEIQHVYWRDFLTSHGRKWSDVWWVARKHVYSRDELTANFGAEIGQRVPLGAELEMADTRDQKDDTFKRAEVWEIWDRSKKQRVYVAKGYDRVLRADPDPYKLQGFFPCPEPLYGVKTTSTLVPVPEYTLYQDQAEALDQITTRLHHLVGELKRRGVYDASAEGPDNQLSQLATARDNQFLPYKGFAALLEKGGLRNVFQTEDLQPAAVVIAKLYEHRGSLVQTIYEVTGISDVLRGSSNPNETATAQRIKGSFGSLRLQKRQARVQRFIRDLYRIKAELIAEHFTRDHLVEMTGVMMPDRAEIEQARMVMAQVDAARAAQQQPQQPEPGAPGAPPMPPVAPLALSGMPPPMPAPAAVRMAQDTLKAVPWDDVAAILRSDERRGYKIDVETDATARADDIEEKNARIEFITSMQGYLEKSLPAAMQMPALMPLVRELTSFGVRAFKVGRSLEEAFDDAFDQLGQATAQQASQPPPTDPKAEADAAKVKAETEALTARAQADVQAQQAKLQADAFAAQQKTQAAEIEARLKHEHMLTDLEQKRRAGDIKAAGAIAELEAKMAGTMMPMSMQ